MRKVVFEQSGFQDFIAWATLDKKIYQRIVDLIMIINRSEQIVSLPMSGRMVPE